MKLTTIMQHLTPPTYMLTFTFTFTLTLTLMPTLTLAQDCTDPPNSEFCFNVQYYFDPAANTCKIALFKCLSDGNKFPNKALCEQKCLTSYEVCTLPQNSGLPFCPASEKFYYDPIAGECKVFTYRGCFGYFGNGNTFEKKKACEDACEDVVMTTLTPGTGETTTPDNTKTTDDTETTTTTPTATTTTSEETTTTTTTTTTTEKVVTTTEDPASKCSSPRETGTCSRKNVRRWSYFSDDNECKRYNGCSDDSGNSFPSEADCMKSCHVRSPKCDVSTGVTDGCTRKKTRYFYSSGKCKTYKGCPEDTGNSFFSKKICLNACLDYS